MSSNLTNQERQQLSQIFNQEPQDVVSLAKQAKQRGGQAVNALFRVLELPSAFMGGAVKAGSEQLRGEFQPPTAGPLKREIPLTKFGGKQNVSLGELIAPPIVGAARGLRQNQVLFEETPRALGLKEGSPAAFGVGLAAELATPDLGDVALASKQGRALTSAITKKLGKGTKQIGEGLAQRGLRSTKTQSNNFAKAYKKTIGKFIADEKLAGNVAENVVNKIDNLQGQFDDIALNTTAKVDDDLIKQISKKSINNLDQSVQKSQRKAIGTFVDDLIEESAQKGGFSIADLTEKRRILDSEIPSSQFQKLLGGEGVSRKVAQRQFLQNLIQDAAEEIEPGTGARLKEIGSQLGPLYRVADIADIQSSLGKGTLPVGLTDLLAGGAGFSQGQTLEDRARNALGAILLKRTVNNPAFISRGAQSALGAGEALQTPAAARSLRELLRVGKEVGLQQDGQENPQQETTLTPEERKRLEEIFAQ